MTVKELREVLEHIEERGHGDKRICVQDHSQLFETVSNVFILTGERSDNDGFRSGEKEKFYCIQTSKHGGMHRTI